jgi:ABC-type Mn2+/Zn2+ transport system ATPase subunit
LNPDQPNQLLLETKGLACGYNKIAILQDVDFKVLEGEHWAIIGENGEGKSTLLRTLVGLLKPLHGEVTLFPQPNEIALVPQHPTRDLRMPMTTEDFVELGFPPQIKINAKDKKDLVQTALKRLGLSQCQEDISILSGGQFQRAVLARALLNHPCLLFLDEPARGLDQKSNTLFMDELRCCPKHKSPAIVMVLHDLRLLQKYFSHVLWLHDGQAQVIEADNIKTNSALTEFLGSSL